MRRGTSFAICWPGTARQSRGFGRGRVLFADALRESDVVAVLCPLNHDTRGLIGADEIRLMKRDALLIEAFVRGEPRNLVT